MSVYYSPQLVRLLMNERIREAAQARLARVGERDCDAGHKRSILSLPRRHAPAACTC
jgi:hypothetical protein